MSYQPSRAWRWTGAALVFALALTLGLHAQPPGQTPITPASTSQLDQPIAWMQEARKNYAAVRDYTCTLVKRERVKGVLQEENVILMSYRQQPFSVYMKWLSPSKFKGQEVAYVQGKNSNKMRVKAKGILGLADFVSIDPNDRRVMEHSRHTILEAGLGNLIEQTLQNWERERQVNKTQVQVAEYDFNNRRCIRIETVRPERNPQSYSYRSVLFLEKNSKLPMRTENYDWPRAGSEATGDLLEMFSFVDLRFNQNLGDDVFNK